MRSVIQRAFGGTDVLEIVEVPVPNPQPTEVLIRVAAAGVNPVDAMVRSGSLPLLGQPPFTLGWDVAGVVEHAVPGVTRFAAGDAVWGMPFFPRAASAYADYVIAPSRQIARKPANLTFAQAAALPLAGLTAWQALVDIADVRDGQRVLVHGGGGGVGHLAVQIAKARGAEVVATVSAEKAEFVRGLGADEVIDYRATDFTRAVKDVDVVFDTVGAGYGMRSLDVLKPGGVFASATDRRNLRLAEETVRRGFRWGALSVEPDHTGLEALAGLVEAGRLRVHVSHQVDVTDVARAHELVQSGSTLGKIVLTF